MLAGSIYSFCVEMPNKIMKKSSYNVSLGVVGCTGLIVKAPCGQL